MGDTVSFASGVWWILLACMLGSRGADLFSTWVATPTLLHEANPVARWLGWRLAMPLNLALCLGFAFFPLPAVIIATTSALVAAHNFQKAWLMRSLGEEAYQFWHLQHLRAASNSLFIGCLALQHLLVTIIGVILAWSVVDAQRVLLVPFGIGIGMITYALTATFYTLLAFWRIRR